MELNLSSCGLIMINLYNYPKYEVINVSNNYLKHITVADHIKKLYCYNNEITKLNTKNLEILHCSENCISKLKLGENLRELDIRNNRLCELDLSKCINLEYLDCTDNLLRELDLRHPHKIKEIICNNDKPLIVKSYYPIDCIGNIKLEIYDV